MALRPLVSFIWHGLVYTWHGYGYRYTWHGYGYRYMARVVCMARSIVKTVENMTVRIWVRIG